MLADGQIDVGFLRLPLERSFPALVVKPVIREPLVVAMPKGHALGHCGAIPVRSLAEESFILLPPHAAPGLYDQIVGMCRSAGFQPRVAQEASQAQTIISLVSAGLGIAIVPASIQALQRDRVVYRKLRGPASMTAIAVGYEKDNHSMVLQRFLRVVNDATEK